MFFYLIFFLIYGIMKKTEEEKNMTEIQRLKMLEPTDGKFVHMVLDTDTKNEVDDQFALTYAYRLSCLGKLSLDAVYAAPFTHHPAPSAGEGMEESYEEIIKILGLLGRKDTEGFVFRGSDRFSAGTPVESPAASDLIERAKKFTPDDPLYVVAIGAITNVASAIAFCPEIIENIVVVWLGGTETHQPRADEYNLSQDAEASRFILDCGVPLVQLPCRGVVDKFTTTVSELERFIDGKTEIGSYLTSLVRECDSGRASSRVIWDVTAVGWLAVPDFYDSTLMHTPHLAEIPAVSGGYAVCGCERGHRELFWAHDDSRHFMRAVTHIDRDALYNDLFRKINKE